MICCVVNGSSIGFSLSGPLTAAWGNRFPSHVVSNGAAHHNPLPASSVRRRALFEAKVDPPWRLASEIARDRFDSTFQSAGRPSSHRWVDQTAAPHGSPQAVGDWRGAQVPPMSSRGMGSGRGRGTRRRSVVLADSQPRLRSLPFPPVRPTVALFLPPSSYLTADLCPSLRA